MNRKRLFVALSAVAALLSSAGIISSCQPENFNPLSGQPVRFTAATGGPASGTKASYSGVVSSGKERIDWESGDTLRIYCAQASEPGVKYADYGVTEVESSGSQAKIDGFGGVGLRWGDNVNHVFFAVYPSPAVNGKSADVLGEGTLTANIPATQVPVSLNDTAAGSEPHFTAVPDLKSEYMVAVDTVKKDTFDPDAPFESDVVLLTFKPIVTAIEFTIKNAFAADTEHPENEILNIKNIQLISAGHNIAGSFTADLTGLSADGSTYPKCVSTSTGKTVTMDFTEIPGYDYSGNAEIAGSKKYVKVGRDSTLRFTFFLKPEYAGGTASDVNDLTFKINKADGSWVSTKLAYNDAAMTGVTFPCHKKSYVSGILVPEGAQWTIKYGPDVASWNAGDDSPVSPQAEVSEVAVVTSWDTGVVEDLNMQKRLFEFIDLGLPSGTKWANMNIGATTETEYGDHYAWGELSTKSTYTLATYRWPSFGKYNGTDNLYTLQAEDDVAHQLLGGRCHIPTRTQFEELFNSAYTTYSWVSNYSGSGTNGYLVTSKLNGNTIFLPAAGLSGSEGSVLVGKNGCYWSSTLNPTPKSSTPYPSCAIDLDFSQTDSPFIYVEDDSSERYLGQSIRAVKEKPIEYVEIGGLKWATCNVGASNPKEYGWYFFWGGTEGYEYDSTNKKWVKASDHTTELSGAFCWENTPFNNGSSVYDGTYFSAHKSEWLTDDILKSDYDAAHANWGGEWRMPKKEDFRKLYEACGGTGNYKTPDTLSSENPGKGIYWVSKEQTLISDYTGVTGLLFCDGEGHKLFFPAAGYGNNVSLINAGSSGDYWSGSLESFPDFACYLYFLSDDVYPQCGCYRHFGQPVRPVHD